MPSNPRTIQPSDQAYLRAAFSVLGLSEIEGAKHAAKVLAMYAASGHPEIHDDETPWCAAFIGWCLAQGHLVGTHSLLARSYATYGQALDRTQRIPRGAIAVWTRVGGGHVNFVLDDDGTYVTCIGGNQANGQGGGDTISRRARAEALAYRLPPQAVNIPLPKPRPAVVDVTPEVTAPKSMATSKIGAAQIVSGAAVAAAGGGEVAKSVLETTTETVAQVSEVASQTGVIVETTKIITTAAPEGFWMGLIHVLTSPAFIAFACVVVIASAGLTWYWRRQHRQAGV